MKVRKTLSLFVIVTLVLLLFAGCAGGGQDAPTGNSTPGSESTPAAPAEQDAPSSGYEEGVSPTDDIVNTTATDKVILVVSFGTSYNESRHLTIGGIETAIKAAYPDYQVRRAFTSQIIIDKLAEREGLKIDNVTEAMNRLVLDKVKEVIIQPTTVLNGFEYDGMVAEVMPFADKFESIKIGKWLFGDESDYDKVVELLVNETKQYRANDTAIVLMGHGTEHEAGEIYTKLQDTFNSGGYTDYVIGTVEHGIEIDEIREILADMGVSKVVLRPLMIVAGDHANNDMAGDEEDAWKVILKEDGYDVEIVLEGLGQIKGVQDIFIKHVQEAMNESSLEIAPAAYAAGVTAGRIKNGTYSLDVETDSSMFRVVGCELTVEDNSMTAVVTLSGQGFSALYMGSKEQAEADESGWYDYTLVDEKHNFTIPVFGLDAEANYAALGKKSGNWYDHVIVFKSDGIPDDAFLESKIDVTLSGGSGRAGVESPAVLLYENSQDIARVVWSSPNYTYMIVDGQKYLPVNTQGNSTFEIPIKMDVDLPVVACTVAMSEPREVEYTLRFDSGSIEQYD